VSASASGDAGKERRFTGPVPTTLPPVSDNSALKAKYQEQLKKLTRQVKSAKEEEKTTTGRKVKALLARYDLTGSRRQFKRVNSPRFPADRQN
jgi:hypothetical protein